MIPPRRSTAAPDPCVRTRQMPERVLDAEFPTGHSGTLATGGSVVLAQVVDGSAGSVWSIGT